MRAEPSAKRTVVFVDGQNLYHAAREAFGYTYPNYDILPLARHLCHHAGWHFAQARFYTGIPDRSYDPFWNQFWVNKLRTISRDGIYIYSRPLRYRNRKVRLPDGRQHTVLTGEEKGP
jgi:hypothetical protein